MEKNKKNYKHKNALKFGPHINDSKRRFDLRLNYFHNGINDLEYNQVENINHNISTKHEFCMGLKKK
jgi:hypothetical protein